jgi:hypothetical protein
MARVLVWLPKMLWHGSLNGCDYFFDRNPENALFGMLRAHRKATVKAFGLVIQHLVTLASRKPLPWWITGGKDGDALDSDGGGKMHWSTVMPDKNRCSFKHCRALAWGE